MNIELTVGNFMDLSKEQAGQVYPVVKENALRHFHVAGHLAGIDEFPNAIAHLILGSEELIKAFVLMLQSKGFAIKTVAGYNKLFSNHTARHNLLKEFYSVWIIVSKTFKIWHDNREATKKDFLYYLDMIREGIDTVVASTGNYVWWDQADKLKQLCFYADITESKLSLPANYDEINYAEANKFVSMLKDDLLSMMAEFEEAGKKDLAHLRELFNVTELPELIAGSINRKPSK